MQGKKKQQKTYCLMYEKIEKSIDNRKGKMNSHALSEVEVKAKINFFLK